MTPEEVKQELAVIELEAYNALKEYRKEEEWRLKRLDYLQDKCPHENMNSASYLRWCTDCGKEWSTT